MVLVKTTRIFKRSSAGKVHEWTISLNEVESGGYEIKISRGQVGGKIVQEPGKLITEGKVKRTVLEQATLQYNSLVKKKRDSGYTDLEGGVRDESSSVLPMLAQNFDVHSSKIVYPAVAQPKLDGVRCMARLVEGEVEMMSRKGKAFTVLSHIEEAIKGVLGDVVLDGELFSQTLTFQRVTGLVRKKDLKPGSVDEKDVKESVKFNVFDAYFPSEPDLAFTERMGRIEEMFANKPVEVSIVRCQDVGSAEDVDGMHDAYVSDGYEGIMLRNKDSVYELDKRSYNLQKYKKFVDKEYKIVDACEGTGNDKGTVIWVCELEDGGAKFNVRPTGTRAQRKEWFDEQDRWFGCLLTVKYQELTDDGIPRFPVGVGIRDYE